MIEKGRDEMKPESGCLTAEDQPSTCIATWDLVQWEWMVETLWALL